MTGLNGLAGVARRSAKPANTITEVTRRAILDDLRLRNGFWWHGRLDEAAFLSRLFDLQTLPSRDYRFSTMAEDHHQHRIMNSDWDVDWVYSDERLNLLRGPDEVFLRFLCEVVHPVVRDDATETNELIGYFNHCLTKDGWMLVEGSPVSGRVTYEARRSTSLAVALPESAHDAVVLSDQYVRELSNKCDARLASKDLEGAITAARTMLEAVLLKLEQQLTSTPFDHKGDLPRLFKCVAKQLRIDEERLDLDDNFKQVARGLVQIVNGLAPIRNKMSDGHPRVRKPEAHHARVIVNAAKTVATFLVESYLFQRDRDMLSNTPPLAAGAERHQSQRRPTAIQPHSDT